VMRHLQVMLLPIDSKTVRRSYDKSKKRGAIDTGLKRKQKKAAMSTRYLAEILARQELSRFSRGGQPGAERQDKSKTV
ncbi:hypothetical protein, partial [Pseudoalteromonas sp. S4492]|uniref:hypothetical protein n=1 Tax=Pseudoalteromonas sp. S4492 TaxID=579560 RepID=UPI001BB125C2